MTTPGILARKKKIRLLALSSTVKNENIVTAALIAAYDVARHSNITVGEALGREIATRNCECAIYKLTIFLYAWLSSLCLQNKRLFLRYDYPYTPITYSRKAIEIAKMTPCKT